MSLDPDLSREQISPSKALRRDERFERLRLALDGMSPDTSGISAARSVYDPAVREHFAGEELSDEQVDARLTALVRAGAFSDAMPDWLETMPDWSQLVVEAEVARDLAKEDARIARMIFIGMLLFYGLILVTADIACRNRIGRTITAFEKTGVRLEG